MMRILSVFLLVLLIGMALFWFELSQYEPMFGLLGAALLILCVIGLILNRQKKRKV